MLLFDIDCFFFFVAATRFDHNR